jgi:hypothetical protein
MREETAMKKPTPFQVSHTDVESAIKNFTAHGGFIQQLPEQKVAALAPVGSRTQVFLGGFGFGAGPEMRFEAK